MGNNRTAAKGFFRDREAFSLAETLIALALLGFISVPAAGYFRLQQRYLQEAGDQFAKDQLVLALFEDIKEELHGVRYSWWLAPPVAETNPDGFGISWPQEGILRTLSLGKGETGWIFSVDGRRRGPSPSEDLVFRPILRNQAFCGIQAEWRGELFYFYTGQQPLPPVSPAEQRSREAPR